MYRLRVCYSKMGRLRFLGHLEVCGALERAVRRARLPIAYGQGFHPKARLAFGPALPVGVAGHREYVDLALATYVSPADAGSALSEALPKGLPLVEAKYVSTKAPSLTSQAAVAVYEVEFVGLDEAVEPALTEGLERLSKMETMQIERRNVMKTYELDRALYRRPRLVADRANPTLEEWLRLSDQAPIRPDAVAGEVASGVAADFFMRITRMEIYAEVGSALVSLGEAAA